MYTMNNILIVIGWMGLIQGVGGTHDDDLDLMISDENNNNGTKSLYGGPVPSQRGGAGGPGGKKFGSDSERGLSDETRLVNALLAKYKKNGKVARPVYDAKKKIIVRFGMRLIQLDIIEKEQALKASVWVRCMKDDSEFRMMLRMDHDNFTLLLELVTPYIQKMDTNCRMAITAAERLSVTLKYMATGETQTSVGRQYRVSRPVVGRIIRETTVAIYEVLRDEYLRKWTDEYLRWRPKEYGGLMTVTLPWDKVWLPDVTLVNTAEAQTEERPADLMVEYTGRVFWAPHKVFKSACLIDVTNFPYDQHTCYMWFQSMSRYSWHLDLQPYLTSPWDLDTYLGSFKESQEWEIKSNLTERFTQSRDIGVLLKFSRRPALRFSLSVRRRLGYTCHLLMLPGVFLISMTLVVFCLPPERPDRHSLAMSLFGSFMVLLLILVEVAPPTAASIPKLGTYYACNMTLVMLSIFLSGTVVNVSRRGETRVGVPWFIKFVFIDVLSYPLLLRRRVSGAFQKHRPMHSSSHGDSRHLESEDTALTSSNQTSGFISAQPLSQNIYTYQMPLSMDSTTTPSNGITDSVVQMDQKLRRMETTIARMGDSGGRAAGGGGGEDPHLRLLKVQWRNVAVVMDRLFFVCYLVIIVTCLIVIFPWPNYS